MMSCRDATTALASDQRLGWRERLALRFHLLLCRHCRQYARQLLAMGKAAREIFLRADKNLSALEKSILDSIRKR